MNSSTNHPRRASRPQTRTPPPPIRDPVSMPDDSNNVFQTTAWERDIGAARGTRVGAAAGARELGCTLYEVDPGGQAAPYHMHHANEELLLVLDGVLELRTPDGTREVGKGRSSRSRPAPAERTGCATCPTRRRGTCCSRRCGSPRSPSSSTPVRCWR